MTIVNYEKHATDITNVVQNNHFFYSVLSILNGRSEVESYIMKIFMIYLKH